MMNGMEKNTTVPTTTNPVYIAGLPTGSWDGGKKVTAKENSTGKESYARYQPHTHVASRVPDSFGEDRVGCTSV